MAATEERVGSSARIDPSPEDCDVLRLRSQLAHLRANLAERWQREWELEQENTALKARVGELEGERDREYHRRRARDFEAHCAEVEEMGGSTCPGL